MPELKHGFGAAKMNKDADERIVPNGEYRDALNIEILTSEGSDVGSMQTLLGNTKITNSQITITPSVNARCVGSIADERNNNLYYFIEDKDFKVDYIFQYNSDSGILTPIVVDRYELDVMITEDSTTSQSNIITSFIISDLGAVTDENLTNVRPGMTISGTFTRPFTILGFTSIVPITVSHNDGLMVTRLEKITTATGQTAWKVYMDETGIDLFLFVGGFSSSSTTNNIVNLKADRVLNFNGDQITGINIIDGILYWTDGTSEPKKIIVDNFIKNTLPGKQGTAVSGELHSFFNVYLPDGSLVEQPYHDFRQHPSPLAEEHITVIKKSPLYPPTLLMSNTSDGRLTSSGTATLISTLDDYFIDFDGENLEVGTIKNITFNSSPLPDYLSGDLILLRKDNVFDDDNLDEFELILEVLNYDGPPGGTGAAKVKINFIQNEVVNSLTNPTANISSSNPPFPATFHSMLQQEKPLYEFKLPRFAYRYKYQDNQYSTYSPFSEPAFLPSDFEYSPKDGYNLGMVNTLRSVYIMDFVTDEDTIPKDVTEIDILYKESNSTNVYTVKTIKYGDSEWIANGSDISVDTSGDARTTGRIQITSEMVRATVASNQLLRPWDNVPRKAKAQEIVGNRIVYANYLQNYNL